MELYVIVAIDTALLNYIVKNRFRNRCISYTEIFCEMNGLLFVLAGDGGIELTLNSTRSLGTSRLCFRTKQ